MRNIKYHYKLYPKSFHVKDEGMQEQVRVATQTLVVFVRKEQTKSIVIVHL